MCSAEDAISEAFPVLEGMLAQHRHAGASPVLKCQLGGEFITEILWARSKNPGDTKMSLFSYICSKYILQVLVSP